MPPAKQQTVTAIGSVHNAREVDWIIAECESGQFMNSSMLIDQTLRDDRVASVIMTRILGFLGKDLEFEPAKDTAQGRRIAEDLEADWPKMVGDSALFELFFWGLMQGVGLAQVLVDGDTWKLEVWHPWSLQWDGMRHEYRVQPQGAGQFALIPDEGGGYLDEEGRRWVVYTPYGYENAGRRALIRSIAYMFLERRYARRDRARYSEIHGQPLRKGIAPATASANEVTAFGNDIGDIGTESAIVVRQGEEGALWDLELVEAMGKSHELFEGEIEELNQALATLLLGQSQSVDGQAGLGSNDQAGEPVRQDLMRADADCFSDMLRAQFLVPYFQFTIGNGDMAPWLCWQVEPAEDSAQQALTDWHTGQAVQLFKQAAVPIDIRAYLEAKGYPLISEQEEARLEAERKAEKAMQAGTNDAPAEPLSNGPNGFSGTQNPAQETADA